MQKIKVLVVDHMPLFREALCRYLTNGIDLEVVADTESVEETMRLVKEKLPDVAVIDIMVAMPNVIDTAKRIREAYSDTALIILSPFHDGSFVTDCMQAAIEGYLLKHVEASEIVTAVRAVYNGDTVYHIRDSNISIPTLSTKKGEGKGEESLNPRELQVIELAEKGLTNKEIARELNISVRTVQTHLVHIFSKIGVHSRTEAVVYCLKKGWI